MFINIKKFFLLILIQQLYADNKLNITNINFLCPNLYNHIFYQSAPIGNTNSGNFSQYQDINELLPCVRTCCEQKINCNIAFIFDEICYHVKCFNNQLCLPKQRQVKSNLQMVLVNPIINSENNLLSTWNNILKNENYPIEYLNTNQQQQQLLQFDENPTNIDENKLNFWNEQHKYHFNPNEYDEENFPIAEKRLNSLWNHNNKIIDSNNNNLMNTGSEFTANQQQQQEQSETYLSDDNNENIDETTTYLASSTIPCRNNVDNMLNNGCNSNEECQIILPTSRNGICQCKLNYKRNRVGICIKIPLNLYKNDENINKNTLLNDQQVPAASNSNAENQQEPTGTDNKEETILNDATTKSPAIKKLAVSVVSKTVVLPDKEVSLAVYTVPDEQSSGTIYKYLWKLISQPNGSVNGTISDQAKDKIKLTNLSEGLYRFKVSVSGNNSYGETIANITVIPEKRINKKPDVIITPKIQIIKPPNSKAILDGSTSIDDDKIIIWHWELIQGPIGYQPILPETSTLQLTDLEKPGNYTFKLTVTDSDHTQNSTTANITVLKVTDYPPEANAGTDVILYLPHNNVTLNGTLSTDDREIVAWEWTKDASKIGQAVDMQHTRTPYLQLSNLEEGFYTFVLKVTDASNQTSSAKVNVFVKPPTNLPPIAHAGINSTINLPQTWIILNGTESTDDIHITNYYWKQINGPNNAIIFNSNTSIANATSLTIGIYEFQLIVSDENHNNAKDTIYIKVVQEKNLPPKANAGGDQTLTLPINAIYLNGNQSTDDLGIVKYLWTRDDSSLVYGNIVGNTSHEPILILTNIVAGRYTFTLTVADEQGLTNSQSISILINQDPMLMNLIELTLSVGITALTTNEYNSIIQKIVLLIGNDIKIHIRELKKDARSGEAILVFYVDKINAAGKIEIIPGIQIEKILKEKFWRDANLLGTPFTDIRTTICQNNCSNHGSCNSVTRACMCETFWMPSVFYFWGVDDANCDWSILYVVVGVFVGFLLLSGLFWGISCICNRRSGSSSIKKSRIRPKIQKYSLLGTQEDELPSFTRGTSLTDSETDSDVLFESRSKQNGILRSSNHNGHIKNGPINKYPTTRLGRRIKT